MIPQVQPVINYKPTATKPKIVPKKKVKPLHWTRILLLPKEAPNRPYSYWDNLKDMKTDQEEVENLFETKVVEKKPGEVEVKKDVNAKKRFFEDKRSQAIGITLAKIPKIEVIVSGMETWDEVKMNRNSVQSLLRGNFYIYVIPIIKNILLMKKFRG